MNRFVEVVTTTVIVFWPYMFFDNAPIWVGVMSFFVLWVHGYCVSNRVSDRCIALVREEESIRNRYKAELDDRKNQYIDELKAKVARLEEQAYN